MKIVTHPSIKSYFDANESQQEIAQAFSRGLAYAGHSLMVPEPYSYQVLPHFNDRRAVEKTRHSISHSIYTIFVKNNG